MSFGRLRNQKHNYLKCIMFVLLDNQKISPRLTSLMLKWNVELKCLLTFFGQLAPLRVMPKTGSAPKPERPAGEPYKTLR